MRRASPSFWGRLVCGPSSWFSGSNNLIKVLLPKRQHSRVFGSSLAKSLVGCQPASFGTPAATEQVKLPTISQKIAGQPSSKPRVIVLTGPTAVGKTNAALALAERIGGEIISADSVQVYAGLDVGSDKVCNTGSRPVETTSSVHCCFDAQGFELSTSDLAFRKERHSPPSPGHSVSP